MQLLKETQPKCDGLEKEAAYKLTQGEDDIEVNECRTLLSWGSLSNYKYLWGWIKFKLNILMQLNSNKGAISLYFLDIRG